MSTILEAIEWMEKGGECYLNGILYKIEDKFIYRKSDKFFMYYDLSLSEIKSNGWFLDKPKYLKCGYCDRWEVEIIVIDENLAITSCNACNVKGPPLHYKKIAA